VSHIAPLCDTTKTEDELSGDLPFSGQVVKGRAFSDDTVCLVAQNIAIGGVTIYFFDALKRRLQKRLTLSTGGEDNNDACLMHDVYVSLNKNIFSLHLQSFLLGGKLVMY
jgi:hypothetical protein